MIFHVRLDLTFSVGSRWSMLGVAFQASWPLAFRYLIASPETSYSRRISEIISEPDLSGLASRRPLHSHSSQKRRVLDIFNVKLTYPDIRHLKYIAFVDFLLCPGTFQWRDRLQTASLACSADSK